MPYPPNRPRVPLDVSWACYWQALQQCDAWWKRVAEFSIFPPGKSWVGVIQKLRPSMNRDWSHFDAEHQKRLLGSAARYDDNWALLGHIRGPARKSVFGNSATRRRIESTIKRVISAGDSVFLETATSAYASLTALRGIKSACATRLLTLARPDRCVSLNSASERDLAAYAAPAPTNLSDPNFYGKLLQRIHKQPWFSRPKTGFGSPMEEEAWSMRVALLDAFIYIPQDTLNIMTELPNPFAEFSGPPEPDPPQVSSLTLGEKSRLERLLGMADGVVLDFSNRSFDAFFAETFEIQIYGPRYEFRGPSKAKRLRALWHIEPDALVANILAALIDRAEQAEDAPDPDLVKECRQIVSRLRGDDASFDDLVAIASVENLSQLQDQLARARDRARDDPDLAIGTAKEVVETVCKTTLGKCGAPLPSAPKFSSLLRATLKELNLVPEAVEASKRGTDTVKRILGSLGSLGNGLAELRNLYGTGHGRDGAAVGLQPRHARLAVGAMSALAVFLFETHEARMSTDFSRDGSGRR